MRLKALSPLGLILLLTGDALLNSLSNEYSCYDFSFVNWHDSLTSSSSMSCEDEEETALRVSDGLVLVSISLADISSSYLKLLIFVLLKFFSTLLSKSFILLSSLESLSSSLACSMVTLRGMGLSMSSLVSSLYLSVLLSPTIKHLFLVFIGVEVFWEVRLEEARIFTKFGEVAPKLVQSIKASSAKLEKSSISENPKNPMSSSEFCLVSLRRYYLRAMSSICLTLNSVSPYMLINCDRVHTTTWSKQQLQRS